MNGDSAIRANGGNGSELELRLRRFARGLLERRGGLLEWEDPQPEGLAILPAELAGRLGVADAARVTTRPVAASAGQRDVLSVSLAGDFLERVEPLVQEDPAQACLRIPELYLKRSAMEEPVAQAFQWANARVKVTGAAAARVEYQTWHFRATLESEDRWEELLAVGLNARSGAMIGLPDALELSEAAPWTPAAPPAPHALPWAARHAARLMQQRSQPFVQRLEQRVERDRKRLKDYYSALLRETKSARGRVAADPQKVAEKRRVVELELRRKTLELEQRYAIRAALLPVALVRLEMPALAVTCDVLRKQTRGVFTVYWNALLRRMEPAACTGCGANIQTVYFDDQHAAALCAACYNA